MRKTLFTIKLFTIKDNGLTFAIKVSPKAKKNCIGDVVLDQNNQPILKIYITAPPEDGKANKAIINLLSKAWNLKKNQIKIVLGTNQRNKVVNIEGNSKILLEQLNKFFKQ